jgi:transcription antitermination protein NusB
MRHRDGQPAQGGEVTAPEISAKRAPHKSPRRRAREFVVQGLYQHLIGGQDEASIRAQAESVAGFDKADTGLYASLLSEALAHLAELRDHIAPHVDRAWDEVSPIERSILLLGTCELQLHPETPYRVVINEAIELAKVFGGTDGHKFVNGILDKLAPLLRPDEARGR